MGPCKNSADGGRRFPRTQHSRLAMGRGRKDCLGLGFDHPGKCLRGSPGLLAQQSVVLRRQAPGARFIAIFSWTRLFGIQNNAEN